MRVRVTKTAESDLDRIFVFWARGAGIDSADTLIDGIEERFVMLGEHPLMGRTCVDTGSASSAFPLVNTSSTTAKNGERSRSCMSSTGPGIRAADLHEKSRSRSIAILHQRKRSPVRLTQTAPAMKLASKVAEAQGKQF
jgi:plasmid stabilization system protein ParE